MPPTGPWSGVPARVPTLACVVPAFAVALGVLAIALGVWSAVAAIRGVRPSGPQLLLAAVLELALVVQAVVAVVLGATRGTPGDGVLFAGYMLTTVVVLPAGVFWGIADRSRWGNGVLAVAAFTTAVLVLRLEQVWEG